MSSQTVITVAMSGGVDSSVTAALLKRQGYTVRGVFMAFGQPEVESQIARVRRLASTLAVPLEIVNLRDAFERDVLAYFCAGYRAGRTPNPCVVCNRTIKCGVLLEGIPGGRLATGHYARIRQEAGGGFELCQGKDRHKDQSYFLCRLGQEQLARLLFPLGELTKDEVRRLAGDLGLAELHSPESQDICFLQGTSVAGFLESGGRPPAGGDIVDRAGNILGSHAGIHRFTIGQRRGLGLPDATPYYVVGLDANRRQVIVGKGQDLWQSRFLAQGVHWLAGEPPRLPATFAVKIRYRHQPAPAEIVAAAEGNLVVTFAVPQRALTPGQFAVFYEGEQVLGSGEIAPAGEETR